MQHVCFTCGTIFVDPHPLVFCSQACRFTFYTADHRQRVHGNVVDDAIKRDKAVTRGTQQVASVQH